MPSLSYHSMASLLTKSCVFLKRKTWQCICVCLCECVGTVKPLCERVHGGKKWPGPAEVLPNTLLSLLEPCLAVILKKSELRTDGGGSPQLFFLFFFISLIFFFIFLWEYCDSCFSVAWITSIKETEGEKKEIYNLYYTVLWTKYKSITLCYIYIIIFLDFSSWDGKIFFFYL